MSKKNTFNVGDRIVINGLQDGVLFENSKATVLMPIFHLNFLNPYREDDEEETETNLLGVECDEEIPLGHSCGGYGETGHCIYINMNYCPTHVTIEPDFEISIDQFALNDFLRRRGNLNEL